MRMRLEIRKMTQEDSQDVWVLQKQCFSVPWSLDSIQKMFVTEGYYNLIAKQGEVLVGYIGMKTVLDEADITNVAVHPAWRRQEIGKKLLKGLLERAVQQGVCQIFLEVRESNIAARKLYTQAGFKDVDKRKNYYEKPKEDAYIMTWKA